MAALSAVGSVGSGPPSVQFQAQYQAAVMLKQKQAVQSAGNAALQLIQSTLTANASKGMNVDMLA